jgi:molecular chaperone Hsp33
MQFKPNSERVHKFLTEELTIRAAAVIATQVVEDMRKIQDTYPIATVALGRAMVGSLLMASQLKENQELSLYFQGNGPLNRIFSEATFEGKIRAYITNPHFMMESEGEGIQVGPAVGIGLLTVTHNLPNNDTPHRGTVIIRTGEIGDDLAFYLEQSHQIPSVVALGVSVDAFGRVTAAGGVLIELMPGASEEAIAKLEERVKQAPSISKRILEGATAQDLITDYLKDFKITEMDHPHPIEYSCRCTIQRVTRSLSLLGLKEIDEIMEEAKPLAVACEFCGREYSITKQHLEKLRSEMYKESLN